MSNFFLQYKLLVFSLVLSSLSIFAQANLSPKLKFIYYDIEDGLSNNIINSVVQDSIGFIWIGTNDGLCRYDGNNFKVYKKSFSQSNSISNNFVQSLFVGSNGQLWIMTDQGLNLYNIEKDSFELFSTEDGLNHNSVTTVAEDTKKTYYVGSYGGGIDVLKDGENIYNFSNNGNLGLSSNLVSSLQIQNDTLLWAGTWYNGLNKINLLDKTVDRFDFGPNSIDEAGNIHCLYLDKDQFLWIGTDNGLSVLNTVNNSYFFINETNCSSFTDNEILSILEDKDGVIWIGTRNSGILTAPKQKILFEKNITNFSNYGPKNNSESVNYRSISSLYQDNQGNIWIGTHLGGVNVVNPIGEAIRLYDQFSENDENLSNKSVWGICEDNKNNIWAGTDGGGLYLVNPFNYDENSVDSISAMNQGLSDYAILSACSDQNGNVWLGTYARGINRFDPKTNSFKQYNANMTNAGLLGNDIRVIFEDSSGQIWAGSNGYGLYRYNSEKDNFEFVEEVGYLDVRALTEDTFGNIWIGTFGNGIMSFSPRNKDLKRYKEYDALNAHIVFSLSFSSSEDLWIGTRYEGLIHYNLKTAKITQYTERDGISNNTIQSIVVESPKNLWLSTNDGINFFDIEEQNFIKYGPLSNVQSGAFNNNSGFKSANGYIVFGGINGLNIFYPNELKKRKETLKILLSDFKIYNSSVAVSSDTNKTALEKSITTTNKVKLKHHEDVITINYTALKFPSAKSINYLYKLDNYDNDWNDVGNSTSATYRNLPPGEYTFLVKVNDNDLKWNSEITSLQITILPPFWLTYPALLLYILLSFLLMYIVLKYYTNQVRLKNSLFYEQKLRQNEDILNQEKFRFFTSFSHELRTPLTLILGPVKDILEVEKNDTKKSKLSLIQRNAKVLLELINNMLEFRKTETEHNHLVLGHYNFTDFVKEIHDNFSFLANQKMIKFTFNAEKEYLIWFDSKKLQIIINNLIANAFKFTEANGEITINLRADNENVILSISDNGIGIKDSEVNSIFDMYYHGDKMNKIEGSGIGLSLCKKLIDLHQGTISVKSEYQKGSTFIITLKKNKAHYETLENAEFIETKNIVIDKPLIDDTFYLGGQVTDNLINDDDKVLLIVDDNEDMVHYLYDIMSSQYKVFTASNGKKGVEKAIEIIPDLIITDLMMPEKSGIDLCLELKFKEQTSHIPIVLLTAKHEGDDKLEAIKIGADDYINKPFDSEYLITRIENLFKNRERLINYYTSATKDAQSFVTQTKEDKFLEKLENSILESYSFDDISIPKLAENLGFSRSSLYRKIKAITGMSIHSFVRKIRLDQIAKLITEEDCNISEAAYKMGFSDLKYFRVVFKEQFGMTASAYKNKKAKPK